MYSTCRYTVLRMQTSLVRRKENYGACTVECVSLLEESIVHLCIPRLTCTYKKYRVHVPYLYLISLIAHAMRASSVQSSTTAPGVSSVPSVVGVASALSLSERLERRRQEKMGVQSDHPVAAEKAAGKMVTFDDSAAGQLHEPCRKTGGVRDEPPQSGMPWWRLAVLSVSD